MKEILSICDTQEITGENDKISTHTNFNSVNFTQTCRKCTLTDRAENKKGR